MEISDCTYSKSTCGANKPTCGANSLHHNMTSLMFSGNFQVVWMFLGCLENFQVVWKISRCLENLEIFLKME